MRPRGPVALLDELAYRKMKATLEDRDGLLEVGELTAVMDQLFGRLLASDHDRARLEALGADRAYRRISARSR